PVRADRHAGDDAEYFKYDHRPDCAGTDVQSLPAREGPVAGRYYAGHVDGGHRGDYRGDHGGGPGFAGGDRGAADYGGDHPQRGGVPVWLLGGAAAGDGREGVPDDRPGGGHAERGDGFGSGRGDGQDRHGGAGPGGIRSVDEYFRLDARQLVAA